MYYSLYIDNSAIKIAEDNELWCLKYRSAILEFQRNQMLDFGLLHLEFQDNPVGNRIVVAEKKGKLLTGNLIFPSGMSMILSQDLFYSIRNLNLPKFQYWNVNLEYRKQILNNFYLTYFYYDYFSFVDFGRSKFEIIEPKFMGGDRHDRNSYTDVVIDQSRNFTSFDEYKNWNISNVNDSLKNTFEKSKLKLKSIVFQDFVHHLDLIPSYYLDFRFIISEGFKSLLENEKISHVKMFNCVVPIQSPPAS